MHSQNSQSYKNLVQAEISNLNAKNIRTCSAWQRKMFFYRKKKSHQRKLLFLCMSSLIGVLLDFL